jgi:hypothetical protein
MSDQSRLAVLEATFPLIVQSIKDHERRDDERFHQSEVRDEKIFNFVKDMKMEILESIGNLDDKITEMRINKIDPLWDEQNQRKGAFKFSGILSHCVTSIITLGGALGIIKVLK